MRGVTATQGSSKWPSDRIQTFSITGRVSTKRSQKTKGQNPLDSVLRCLCLMRYAKYNLEQLTCIFQTKIQVVSLGRPICESVPLPHSRPSFTITGKREHGRNGSSSGVSATFLQTCNVLGNLSNTQIKGNTVSVF